MLSFGSLNFDNIGIPTMRVGTSDIVDAYDNVMEKKNNYIATKLANNNDTKKRASATVIGAAFGAFQVASLTAAYGLIKMYPKLNNKLFQKLFVNNFDRWIAIAKKNHPNASVFSQVMHGIGAKSVWAIASGALFGYACDLYSTLKNTVINRKISNTTAGAEGSVVASTLKSLSSSDTGKSIIKNAISKNNDGSITIKFKGVNKEYNITKKELKKASRAYLAKTDETGKVTGFEKKFSKGDGDTLAFEVAFEKYCNEINSGVIPRDKNVPLSVKKVSKDGDILFRDCSIGSFYYLMTGNKASSINALPENNKDSISEIYSKSGIQKFLNDYSNNSNNYVAEIKLKDTDNKTMRVRDKFWKLHDIKTDKKYAITNIDNKYITLTDSTKTRKSVNIPIERIKDNIECLSYTNIGSD